MPDAHVPQACLDGFEHPLVVSRVLDDQVAAHRDHPAGDGPDVEVVHRGHAGDGRDPVVDVREGDVRGRRLEQHVRALLYQPPGAAEDQQGDQHRDDWIGLHPPRGQDDHAREQGADRAEQVAHDVEVRAALVERVVVAAMQDRGPKGVGRQSYAGDDQEQRAVHLGGRLEPAVGLEADTERDHDQGRPVHERRQDLQPQQSERPLRRHRPLCQCRHDERQTQRGHVGQQVCEPPAHGFGNHHRGRDRQHDLHPPPALLAQRSSMRALDFQRYRGAHLSPFLRPASPKSRAVPPPGNTPYVPASMPGPGSESLGLRLLAVLALVLANAFFVAAEFALVAARRTRIEALVRRGDRRARTVQAAFKDLYRQLSAAQLGITVASILLGYVAEDTVAQVFRDWFAALPPALEFLARGGVASTVAVALVSFLHVVFGEQAPKAWAITHPERTSRWIAAPLIFFSWITRAFTALLNWSASRVVRLLGLKGTSAELEAIPSPEELRMLVEQSRQRGKLDADDARLLQGVFEFSEKTAREVMTPRTEMVALPADLTLEEAADQVAVAGRSRYPVYGESLDDILGIVHAKDILAGLRAAKGGGLRAVVRPAMFVPGTREVEDVLADMKRQKSHLAIVLDEFGGTAGLVTMEDLLEEIVGQIYDEYDRPSGELRSVPAGVAPTIAGSVPIREVNSAFGLELGEQDYTTIGGFLFGAIGRLPRPGDQVAVKGAVFEIVEV